MPLTIQLQDNKVYQAAGYDDQPENFIAQGVVAAVYRGKATPSGEKISEDVAVKIPHHVAGNNEMQHEYDLLHRLAVSTAEKYGRAFTPPVALGQQDGDERLLLVMPYYTHRLQDVVRDHVANNDFIAAERLATRAIIAFTLVMDVLHEGGQVCWDRKIKDFYLVDDDQLVVIDWNVLQPFSADNAASEMQIIGRLWHELFVRSQGAPPFKPLQDERWRAYDQADLVGGAVSIGMRYLLAEMVKPKGGQFRNAQGTPDPGNMRQAFEAWAVLLGEDEPQLSRRIQAPDVTGILGANIALTTTEAKAILYDLIWRQRRAYPGDRYYFPRQEAVDAARTQHGNRDEIYALTKRLERGQANALVERALAEADENQQAQDWGHLKRLQMLTSINAFSAGLRRYGEDLPDWVRTLDRSPQGDDREELTRLQHKLQDVIEQSGSDAEKIMIQTLLNETMLRIMILDYNADRPEKMVQRERVLDEMEKLLASVPYFDPDFADAQTETLLDSVVDLEFERDEIDKAARFQDELAAQRGELLDLLIEPRDWKRLVAQWRELPRDLQEDPTIAMTGAVAILGQWVDHHLHTLDAAQFQNIVLGASTHLRTVKRQFASDPNIAQDLINIVHGILVDVLEQVQQLMGPIVTDASWETWQAVNPFHNVLQQPEVVSVYAELPDDAQRRLDRLDDINTRCAEIETFYRKWMPFLADRSVEHVGDAADYKALIQQRVPRIVRQSQKLLDYIAEAKALGIDITPFLRDVLAAEYDDQSFTVQRIIEAGIKTLLRERTLEGMEETKNELLEGWRQELDALRKQQERDIQEYRDARTQFDDDLKLLQQRLRDFGQDVAGAAQQRRELKALDERVQQVESQLSTLGEKLISVARDHTALDRRFDRTFSHTKALEVLHAAFEAENMEEVNRILDKLEADMHEASDEGRALRREIIRIWDERVAQYSDLSDQIAHAENTAAMIPEERNKSRRRTLLIDVAEKLADMMVATEPYVFRQLYGRWQMAFERLFERLAEQKGFNDEARQWQEMVLERAKQCANPRTTTHAQRTTPAQNRGE